MTDAGTRLAALYLAQLEEEARRLPPDEATEMVADIREHIAAATAGHEGEAHTRDVLDRLGSPHALVVEALGAEEAPAAPPADLFGNLARRLTPSPTWSARESNAILCLIAAEIGAILVPFAFIGWLWGLRNLTTSLVWTTREKVWGGLTLGLGFPVAAVAAITAIFAAQWSFFTSAAHQVCSFGGGNTSSNFGFNTTTLSICHSSGSSTHPALIALAVVGALLIVSQIIAVRMLLQARHRAPAI